MSSTTKKLAEAFIQYRKQTVRKSPFRTFVGPAPANQVPAAFAPEANEVLPPPVTDHERAGARQQAAEIAVMAETITERFSAEDALVQTLTKLVATLNALIESAPLAKHEPATVAPARGKRFIRTLEPAGRVDVVNANGLDGMLLDATRRVRKGEEYH